MPLEEEQLNGRIASLIRNQTADLGWHVQEEAKGSFQHDKLKKPDIVIRRIDAPPVVIENEYAPARTLEGDFTSRLGRWLEPDARGHSGEVSVVFALRTPESLQEWAHGDEAEAMLRAGAELEFAVYRGKQDDLCHERLLPANEAYRDPVRHEIDRRFLVDVLDLGEDAVDQFAILRNQWCAEPSVTGTKRTDIQYNS